MLRTALMSEVGLISAGEFVRSATPALALVDLQGRAIAVSNAFAACLGLAPDSLERLELRAWQPAPPTAWLEAYARALDGAVVHGEAELLVQGEGRTRWVSWTVQPWRREGRGPAGVLIALDDVTQPRRALHAQVRALTALSRSEHNVVAAFEPLAREASCTLAATLGVDRIDIWLLEGETLRCVAGYDGVTQRQLIRDPVARQEAPVLALLGQHHHLAASDLWSDPSLSASRPLFAPHARSALSAGLSAQGRLLGLVVCQSTWDQREWSVEDGVFVNSVAALLSLAIETARLHAAESGALERMRQLDEARAHAELADRAKSEFLATVSHEIRTPMNGVLGFTNLLMDTALNDDQRSLAATVKASAEALLTLVNDILDVSKIEAGKFELEAQPFDLEAVVGDVMELCSAGADAKGVRLAVQYAGSTPRRFIGDAGRVRQVLLNLVGNGIKFTSAGSVSAQVQSHLGGVKVSILDSGIGIEEEAIGRLFAQFVQADSSTTRRFGGTGLGLVIARRLVELMGGTIGVESGAGMGSTFWFTLPGALPYEPVPVVPQSMRALLIERDLAVTEMWCSTLSRIGMSVAIMHPGEELLPLELFDLVIVDSDDAEIVDRLRASLAGPRVLLRTQNPLGAALPGISAMVGRSVVRAEAQLRAVGLAMAGRPFVAGARDAAPVTAPPDPTATLAGLKVLVVEDNLVNQRLALRLLQRRGCTITLADNGREGVSAWDQASFDVVLMDCNMPEMGGLEATRLIRSMEASQHRARTPIVALTASAMDSDREGCLVAGMDDYLSKPLRDERLVETLLRVSAAHRVSHAPPLGCGGAVLTSAGAR